MLFHYWSYTQSTFSFHAPHFVRAWNCRAFPTNVLSLHRACRVSSFPPFFDCQVGPSFYVWFLNPVCPAPFLKSIQFEGSRSPRYLLIASTKQSNPVVLPLLVPPFSPLSLPGLPPPPPPPTRAHPGSSPTLLWAPPLRTPSAPIRRLPLPPSRPAFSPPLFLAPTPFPPYLALHTAPVRRPLSPSSLPSPASSPDPPLPLHPHNAFFPI